MELNNNVQKDIQERLNYSIELIKNQYLDKSNNLPWLIGYSGGKDSTCTAQLVFRALLELKSNHIELLRKVTIFSSDTMIENPLVKEIIQKNIKLINKKANELELPIDAVVLKPEIEKTFWVNVIGRGYPTPNTMFRWCTDRLKIDPANNFIHKCITANGEVIMVLGVREGESNTRDRVLKKHEINGATLMRHTTLSNAYIFAPIKHLTTIDIFTYLSEYDSPWGSNNKELFFLYEESGGGECQIFLSEQDKTSSNSCGNSRMGCWICTVVAKDKSLSGFIDTGLYDFLKPLLDFRNWIVSIRDEYKYRCHYRKNGSIYKVAIKRAKKGDKETLIIPKKGDRGKIIIEIKDDGTLIDNNGNKFFSIDENDLNDFMNSHGYNFNSPELENLILKDSITGEYSKLGSGPYTNWAKLEIFRKLIETEKKYNKFNNKYIELISDGEIIEIKKLWKSQGINPRCIDEILSDAGRELENTKKDSFNALSDTYEKKLKKLTVEKNVDFNLIQRLLYLEKCYLSKTDRKEMQSEIETIFNSDRVNF